MGFEVQTAINAAAHYLPDDLKQTAENTSELKFLIRGGRLAPLSGHRV
jgi:hypothetical protein